MRILHTSDWHLGRSFKKVPLADEQAAFVDRAMPPADAVEAWTAALRRIVEAGAQVVGIAGNHDQGQRIDLPQGLLRDGLVLRGSREPSTVTLEFDDGPLLVAPLPFLDPFLARDLAGDDGPATHQSVIEGWLAPVRDAATRSPRSLVVSHAFVRGGTGSESERALQLVGGAEQVDPSIFDGFSYVALGHLHRPQLVGGDERIAYCGSPIPYSFSETEPKSLRIVDLAADGTLEGVATIPVEAGWPVATIEGSFDELVADERFAEFEKRCFVRAVLTDRVVQPGAMDRLRTRFEGIVQLGYLNRDDVRAAGPDGAVEGEEVDPRELADDFWVDVTGREPTGPEGLLLDEAIRAGFGDGEAAA